MNNITHISSSRQALLELFNFGKIEFLSLKDLKLELKKYKINSQSKYIKYRKEKNKKDWPSNPNRTYKIFWRELFDKEPFLSLKELKFELKKYKINSKLKYKKYRKEKNKKNWPPTPNRTYKISWRELFDKENLSLKDLKSELKKYKIDKVPKYIKYRKEKNKTNWPSNPDRTYKISYRELFDKEPFLSLKELKFKLKKYKINTGEKYIKYRKEKNKKNWPSDPNIYYKIFWRELFDKKPFLSLKELKFELKKYKINSKLKYKKYRKEKNKKDWPSNPDRTYKISWRKLFDK
jgi:hypothetical protein